MANIVRGTTPTITMTNSDTTLDLRTLGTPLVSISQKGREIEITDATVLEHSISFTLTQQHTLSLMDGAASIQINFVSGTSRTASSIEEVGVTRNLHNEVI